MLVGYCVYMNFTLLYGINMKFRGFIRLSFLLSLLLANNTLASKFDINTFEVINSNVSDKEPVGIYGAFGPSDEPRVVVLGHAGNDSQLVFTFPNTITKKDVFFISDKNGDGVNDIAFFGKNKVNERYQLFVKSGLNPNELVGKWNWPIKWQDAQVIDAGDVDGDGIRDVGLFATNTNNLVPQVSLMSGAKPLEELGVYSFPKGRVNKQVKIFDDSNADKIDEFGVFSLTRKNKPVLFIRSGGLPSVKIEQYNWPANWTEQQVVKLPDLTGDNVAEIGLFGRRIDDGRWQLHVKNGTTKKGVVGIYSWPASFENVCFHIVDDMTADGSPDFAVFGFNNASAKWQLQIKSSLDRSLVNNITWSGDFSNVELLQISDIDNNGVSDFALAGKRESIATTQVQVKDGLNSNLIQSLNVVDMVLPTFKVLTINNKKTLNVVGLVDNKPQYRKLSGNGEFHTVSSSTAIFVDKYKTGVEVFDYSASSHITIGEGDYAINLEFSGRGSDSVYFYNDQNNGVDISHGALQIKDVSDVTKFTFQRRTVSPEINSNRSVVVAKNFADYYAIVQVLDVRNDGYDGNIDSVVFEWAIRTDGGTDFTSFEGKKGPSLVSCKEPSFFDSGGCRLVDGPYNIQSSSSIQQFPRPDNFVLGQFTLISHGLDISVSDLVAEDLNRRISPSFSGISDGDVITKNHSRTFTLNIPPTSYLQARPFFRLGVTSEGREKVMLEYSGSFTSN